MEVDEAAIGLSRDALVAVLHAENIGARRYFFPGCHRMEPYRSYYPNARLLLENTERVARLVVCLPTGSAITGGDADRICDVVDFAVRNGTEITRRVGQTAILARQIRREVNQRK